MEPDGLTVRIRGLKGVEFKDSYETYSHKTIAKAVKEKLLNFKGIK